MLLLADEDIDDVIESFWQNILVFYKVSHFIVLFLFMLSVVYT